MEGPIMDQNQKILSLVAQIEQARRAKDYARMNILTGEFHTTLDDENSPEAWKASAKVSYELHMAEFQQYQDASDHPQSFLVRSLYLAEQSSEEAKRAGDRAGKLFPRMNIGGCLLPALDQWGKGMAVLRSTLKNAERALPSASPEDVPRYLRVMMSCYLFLIELAVAHNGDPHEVERHLRSVVANPIFHEESAKRPGWEQGWVQKAEAYFAGKA